MRNKMVFNVVFSALMVALSVVLDVVWKFIPFVHLPNGGSVSLAMLPICVGAIVCGGVYGAISGFVFGFINFLIDGYGFNIVSFFLDYVLCFAGVGLLGLFRKQILNRKYGMFVLGMACVFIFRWICHGFSGVILFTSWYTDKTLLETVGWTGKLAIYQYSFIYYNLPYLLGSFIACTAVGLIAYKPLFLTFNVNKEN